MANGFHKVEHRPMVVPPATLQLIRETDRPMEVITLYMFYYECTIEQGTSKPTAPVQFCSKKTKMSTDRIRRARKTLKEIGLIKDIQKRKDGGDFDKTYTQVLYYDGSVPPDRIGQVS